jgi:hypothetical protein
MTLTEGINAAPVDNVVLGEVFAFSATGGYTMAAGFATITTLEQTTVSKFDVTDALQVTIAASVLNDKLVLASYDATLQTFADSATFVASTASISLSAAEFQTALVAKENIVSVGAYASMYANFKTYVTTYFGVPGGFASLFNQATLFTLTGTDQENLYDLLKPLTPEAIIETPTGDDVSGNYVNDLTGSITIDDITKLLRYAVDFNAFGNRAPGAPDSDSPNIGVANGFLAGDLIYVAAGTQITLDLDISPELQLDPFNNLNLTEGSVFGTGGSTVAGLTTAGSDGFNALTSAMAASVVAGSYSNVSTVTRTNIKRVLNAPLLIRLI